ncbi:MAG: aspartate dehydrogenase [Candidatus Hydrothermarchaeaceae archaeon]
MKIALIGCGAIGATIARAVRDGLVDVSVLWVMDSKEGRAEMVAELVGAKVAMDIEDVLKSDVELVVEVASQGAVRLYGMEVITSGKGLLVMSVGALADEKLFGKMVDAARKNGVKIYVPSGAIGGLDALASASIGGLTEVTLSTTKPPRSLGLTHVTEKSVIYEGTASEAVKLYPANINVSAAVSQAGLGFDKTRVKIAVDPSIENNVHEIDARGRFGKLHLHVENVPSPDNPKTSYLAALSAIAMLKRIASPLEVGN